MSKKQYKSQPIENIPSVFLLMPSIAKNYSKSVADFNGLLNKQNIKEGFADLPSILVGYSN